MPDKTAPLKFIEHYPLTLCPVCKYLCKLVNIRKIDALGGNVCFQLKTLRVIFIVKAAITRCNNCSVFKNNISAISGVGIGGIFLVELQLEEGVRKLDPVLSFVAVLEVIISSYPGNLPLTHPAVSAVNRRVFGSLLSPFN